MILLDIDWFLSGWNASGAAESIAIIPLVLLIVYMTWSSLRAKK